MKNVFVLSLGCPRNMVDSEVLRALLQKKGFTLSEEAENAEIAIVNTCGFIEDAKDESIEYILRLAELRRDGGVEKLLVCGCLAQRYSEELLAEIEEIDAVFGVDDFIEIADFILEGECERGTKRVGNELSFLYDDSFNRNLLTPKHYAYVKIQEGCSKACSYCIIPAIKGKSRSRAINSVLREVRDLIEQYGVREIVIIGQDTTSFGFDHLQRPTLTDLLRQLTEEFSETWFRLLYTHPENFSDELIDLFKHSPNLLNYIDLPIQHITPRILRLMKRPVTSDHIRSLIEKIRSEIPEAVIRTSVICGFPSETEDEFRQLLDFIKEVEFERLGAFVYSPEEGTLASDMEGQISDEVKRRRYASVMQLQQTISKKKNEALLGNTLKVLVDEVNAPGDYVGRSYMDAPEVDGVIYFKSKKSLLPGQFTKVTVTGSMEYDLLGEANEHCQ